MWLERGWGGFLRGWIGLVKGIVAPYPYRATFQGEDDGTSSAPDQGSGMVEGGSAECSRGVSSGNDSFRWANSGRLRLALAPSNV